MFRLLFERGAEGLNYRAYLLPLDVTAHRHICCYHYWLVTYPDQEGKVGVFVFYCTCVFVFVSPLRRAVLTQITEVCRLGGCAIAIEKTILAFVVAGDRLESK